MRDQSRLVVSLESEKTDIDKKIKIANASARLIEDEADRRFDFDSVGLDFPERE